MTETANQHKHGVSSLHERCNKLSRLKAHHVLLKAKFYRKSENTTAKAIGVTI